MLGEQAPAILGRMCHAERPPLSRDDQTMSGVGASVRPSAPQIMHRLLIDRSLTRLAPRFALAVTEALLECRRRGLLVGLFEGWRSNERQSHLYELGRTLPGGVVTNARDSSLSWHGYGLAADVVFMFDDGTWTWAVTEEYWEALQTVMVSFGLCRPMSWDKAHFQPTAVPVSPPENVRALHRAGKFEDVWTLYKQDARHCADVSS